MRSACMYVPHPPHAMLMLSFGFSCGGTWRVMLNIVFGAGGWARVVLSFEEGCLLGCIFRKHAKTHEHAHEGVLQAHARRRRSKELHGCQKASAHKLAAALMCRPSCCEHRVRPTAAGPRDCTTSLLRRSCFCSPRLCSTSHGSRPFCSTNLAKQGPQ